MTSAQPKRQTPVQDTEDVKIRARTLRVVP